MLDASTSHLVSESPFVFPSPHSSLKLPRQHPPSGCSKTLDSMTKTSSKRLANNAPRLHLDIRPPSLRRLPSARTRPAETLRRHGHARRKRHPSDPLRGPTACVSQFLGPTKLARPARAREPARPIGGAESGKNSGQSRTTEERE